MSEKRKKDHLLLAKESQVKNRKFTFNYEPLLSAHPDESTDISLEFASHHLNAPLWFSSMTGGTEKAGLINRNLAKVAGKYSLGMGLGSCRSLLDSDKHLKDFDQREWLGSSPFYANLGIAQLEELLQNNELGKIGNIVKKLQADGLIIHINPLQEWMQPEGDRLRQAPIETIKQLLSSSDIPLGVKEVGQGIGPLSLKELCKLPIKFIEFGALGGTNFTMLEHARHRDDSSGKTVQNSDLAYAGHTKEEMISFINEMNLAESSCKEFIISGGVRSSIQGHDLSLSLNANNLIGYGQVLLEYAEDLVELDEFVAREIENLKLARCYFKGNK